MYLLYRNLKKSINLTGYNNLSGGAFSNYYKYNNSQGIKVLYSDGHKTIKALRKSRVWQRATKENTTLKKCRQRYSFIPNAYGVFPIKIGKYYYPGICMQHISGITLNSLSKNNSDEWLKIYKNIDRCLRKRGIYHDDLHPGNIMLSNNVYYVIDFTHDLIWLDNGYN